VKNEIRFPKRNTPFWDRFSSAGKLTSSIAVQHRGIEANMKKPKMAAITTIRVKLLVN